ncbi:MAG: DUF3189 family protein [Tumebacillaceae bacterium]
MRHSVYYDQGNGYAALLAAGIRLKLLTGDLLPTVETVAAFLRDHGRKGEPGGVHLLGEHREEKVYWCGLGRSSTVVIRTWRHFLHLYEQPQDAYTFYLVPFPQHRRWRQGMRLLEKTPRHDRARQLIAQAAVREYPVFLTVLMTDWREG